MTFKKPVMFLLALVLLSSMAQIGLAEEETSQGTYLGNLGDTYLRGLKNVVTAPAEIYVGVRDAKNVESKCPAGVKYVAGFFKGIGKTLLRLGSGAADLLTGWFPGYEQWWPAEPETLF